MTGIVTAISARLEAKFVVELGGLDDVQLVRRCADITELLGVLESGGAHIAAISPDFPGMSGTVISELVMRGACVLAVTNATSVLDQRQCEAWGITHIYSLGDGDLADVLARFHDSPQEIPAPPSEPHNPEIQGRVICVWGPPGAPGRTTTALHLARILGANEPTLLIDADTWAPSVATLAGLVDDAPGILALARLVDAGALNEAQLEGIALHSENHLDIVTGIASASRWHELSPAAFNAIVDTARRRYRSIVVDIASEFTAEEALMFDTLAPSRNGVSWAALTSCDHLVALAACDTVGLGRFVSAWSDLRECEVETSVVLTKCRSASIGGSPESVATGALERFAGVRVAALIPDAREELDEVSLLGVFAKPLRVSPYTQAIAALAAIVTGTEKPLVPTKRRRWLKASRLRV